MESMDAFVATGKVCSRAAGPPGLSPSPRRRIQFPGMAETRPVQPNDVQSKPFETAEGAPGGEGPSTVVARRDGLLLHFLRQAPFLPTAADLAVATCPIEPWPHQLKVVRHVTARFPESFLFADEVGLGKTIEAGLVLRQLWISGRLRRALLLVPKGILRQWQEELYEKLVLDVPRYEGGRFFDVRDRELKPAAGITNPWDAFPLLLASSHLAKQRPRRDEILAAQPWDVVLLDEAHHARRRGSGRGGPNQLLELLAGRGDEPGLKDCCRCLYLLSATPMQVHAVELWDLLKLLGMGGRWGSSEEEFLRYFEELRRPFEDRDWSTLLAMGGEVVAYMEGIDEAFGQWAREHLGDGATKLEALLRGDKGQAPRPSGTKPWLQLSPLERRVLDRGLRRHTPLRALAWRHTRGLLRAYRRAGWIDAAVPRRRTRNVWIALRPEERDLYQRIEAFVSDFFQRYEARRKGLGFAMTLYRRRLTSSFYAVRRSLERRLETLRRPVEGANERAPSAAQAPTQDTEDDGWAPLHPSPGETRSLFDDDDGAQTFEDEIVFLEDFLRRLGRLPADSKLERLQRDLVELQRDRQRVLVFTQYTDTMDFLRRTLVHHHGQTLACYSGRGGEIWDGEGWISSSKEVLKERFRDGEIRLLLCTEAAGEGLNLQTCGVLINFDMPWNPMRIEQRIGRIDRIGQQYDDVWILNYFYEDTVEAEIYRRLSHRIGWFEEVVGTLQPILHQVGETIRRLAMLPAGRRDRQLREEIHRLDDQWTATRGSEARALEGLFEAGYGGDSEALEPAGGDDLEARMTETSVALQPPPVTWEQLESVVRRIVGSACRESMPIHGRRTYALRWRGQTHRVTFDPETFAARPYDVVLLTYGQPLFEGLLDDLLQQVDAPPPELDHPQGIGLYRAREPAPVSLFLVPWPVGGDGPGRRAAPGSQASTGLATLENLVAFESAIDQGGRGWNAIEESEASAMFSRRRHGVLRRQTRVEQRRRRARRSALVESARQLLEQAAQVEQAKARRPGLFDAPPPPLGASGVQALTRHGGALASLIDLLEAQHLGEPDVDAPIARRLGGKSSAHLDRLWQTLCDRAAELWGEVESLERQLENAETAATEPSSGGLLERRWFPLGDLEGSSLSPTLAVESVRPFIDGVPFYEDLQTLVEHLRDAPEDQRTGRVAGNDTRWVALEGRFSPRPGLCVVPVDLASMARWVPTGSRCVLRLAPCGPWQGKILLLEHPDIDDDELGGSFTLRRYESLARGSEEEGWLAPQVILHGAPREGSTLPQILEDIEEGSLWVIAELLEVLP